MFAIYIVYIFVLLTFALKGLEIRDMNTHALTSGIHYVCCGNCMHGTASLGMTLYVHVL